jgi:hypothetical protein
LDPLTRIASEVRAQIPDAVPARRDADRVVWESALSTATQSLAVVRLPGGELQLEYHIQGKRGSPFELLWAGDPESDDLLEHIVRFVAELLTERRVLAMAPRFWWGERQFPLASELAARKSKGFHWVVSWRGTYNSG